MNKKEAGRKILDDLIRGRIAEMLLVEQIIKDAGPDGIAEEDLWSKFNALIDEWQPTIEPQVRENLTEFLKEINGT